MAAPPFSRFAVGEIPNRGAGNELPRLGLVGDVANYMAAALSPQ